MNVRWACDASSDERAMRFRWGLQRAMLEWGEEEMRSAKSLWPGKRLSLAKPSFLGPPKISDFWGEQRPWSPADLVERYRLCDPSAECECKITAFFWHGNGLSRMSWGLCPLTCNLRRYNPFYGLSPLSLPFHGCLWKSVPRVCKQPERDVICIFEKRKLFTFYMYSFLDS